MTDLSDIGVTDHFGDRIVEFRAKYQNGSTPYATLNLTKLDAEDASEPTGRVYEHIWDWTLQQARARYLGGLMAPAHFKWFLLEHIRKYGPPGGMTDVIELGRPGTQNTSKRRECGRR